VSCIYRRNGVWYMKTKTAGRWTYRSLGTRDKAVALRKAKLAEPKPTETYRLSDLVNDYTAWAVGRRAKRTVDSALLSLRYLRQGLGDLRIAELTPAVVHAWHAGLPYSPATANLHLAEVQGVVARAIRSGWWAGPHPFKGRVEPLRVPHTTPRWLTQEEQDRLLEVAAWYRRDMHKLCIMGLYLGLRRGEMDAAVWEWFDLETGLCHLGPVGPWRPKTEKPRTIPIAETARGLLLPYSGSGFVLYPTSTWQRNNYYRRNVTKSWKRLTREADLEWVTPHTLRHTFASRLVSAGVSIFKVSQWLGHASVQTTMVYAHLAPKDDDINALS